MKVLILSSIHQQTIDELKKEHDVICAYKANQDQIKSLVADREVIIFRSGVFITSEVMENAPSLKLLIRAGSGIENIDIDTMKKRGVRLNRIPEPGAKAVAELSFALMLALSRNLLKADKLLRQGHWAKYELTGHLLTGKVLGIIGTGNIGIKVGELGNAWGMKVIGCDVNLSPEFRKNVAQHGIQLKDFWQVISESDFLSLHVPLLDSTRNFIDAKVLSKMKSGAFLINLARGGIVDEQALFKNLTNGKQLGGAALDVHFAEGEGKISPLASLPNVILTPHIGAQTYDSQKEIGERVLQIINNQNFNYGKVASR